MSFNLNQKLEMIKLSEVGGGGSCCRGQLL